MNTTVTTFLMFEGKAEEAMNFYTSLFKDGSITGYIYDPSAAKLVKAKDGLSA